MDRSLISTSKFLSLVLRHQPEILGLTLDENGWTDIDELLDAAKLNGKPLSRDALLSVVTENDKQRFAISNDGMKIRANQGHSVDIDLALEPAKPPNVLFHGTVRRFLAAIMREGLVAGSRQHVHLSEDAKTAKSVGKRRGAPIILTIQTGKMHSDGHSFFLSVNGVWLTGRVPVKYITFPGT